MRNKKPQDSVRKMGTYLPLLYAFGRKQLPPRIFEGATRPKTCRVFLPHANQKMHPSCARCGRVESLHV
jgi:hypothetical protein